MANEDITDLTEDEEAAEKGKEKKKKEKKQAPPPRQEDSGEAKPEKKKKDKTAKGAGKKGDGGGKKSIKLKLILIIVPIVLVAACVAAVILNFFGARDILSGIVSDPLISAVVWLDPEFSTVDRELRKRSTEREDSLNKRGAELDERENDITTSEEELDTRAAELDAQEAQLNRRSDQLDRREEQLRQSQSPAGLPAYQRELTEQEISDMRSLSRTYAQMPPESAASIIFHMHRPEDISTIIYYMSERNAAAILAELDPVFAALITEFLIDPAFGAGRYEEIMKEYDKIMESVKDEEENGDEEDE